MSDYVPKESSVITILKHTHTYTHTHQHTCTHTHIHTSRHTHLHTQTPRDTHTLSLTHLQRHTRKQTLRLLLHQSNVIVKALNNPVILLSPNLNDLDFFTTFRLKTGKLIMCSKKDFITNPKKQQDLHDNKNI